MILVRIPGVRVYKHVHPAAILDSPDDLSHQLPYLVQILDQSSKSLMHDATPWEMILLARLVRHASMLLPRWHPELVPA